MKYIILLYFFHERRLKYWNLETFKLGVIEGLFFFPQYLFEN